MSAYKTARSEDRAVIHFITSPIVQGIYRKPDVNQPNRNVWTISWIVRMGVNAVGATGSNEGNTRPGTIRRTIQTMHSQFIVVSIVNIVVATFFHQFRAAGRVLPSAFLTPKAPLVMSLLEQTGLEPATLTATNTAALPTELLSHKEGRRVRRPWAVPTTW